MTSFFWPMPALRARAVALTAAASGIVAPVWLTPTLYGFDGATFATVPVASGATVTDYGFSAAAIGGDNKNYFLEYDKNLIQYGSIVVVGGNATIGNVAVIPLTANLTYLGLAVVNDHPYWLSSVGRVFVETSSGTVEVSENFGAQARALGTDGTNLYAPLPGSGLGILTLTSETTATDATVATPMTNPYLLAGCPTGVAVAGSSYAVTASGASMVVASPTAPASLVALTLPTANELAIFVGTDPAFATTNVASGVTDPTALAWSPTGEQLLVSQTSAGQVSVWDIVSDTLSQVQTLSVVDAAILAITPAGDQALVCQPSQNLIQVLNSAVNVWSLGSTVAATAPDSVMILSNTEAVCGDGTSLAYLSRTGSNWAIGVTVALGFSVSALTQDASGNIYAAGTASASGYAAKITAAAIAARASWTGGAASIFCEQGQLAVADPTNSLLHWFDTSLKSQGTQSVVSGVSYIGASEYSAFLCGTSALWQMMLTAPYTFSHRAYGTVATYLSGEWASLSYPVGTAFSALAWGAGTTLYAVSVQNELYTYDATGTALTQTASAVIPVYTGQTTGESLGISSLLWTGSNLYAVTYSSGVLIQVI